MDGRSGVCGGPDDEAIVAVQEIVDRAVVMVEGAIVSLAQSPVGHSPALHAVITHDGLPAEPLECTLEVVWLGRRRIAGVAEGTRLRVRGRARRVGDYAVVYNPRYELIAVVDRRSATA